MRVCARENNAARVCVGAGEGTGSDDLMCVMKTGISDSFTLQATGLWDLCVGRIACIFTVAY